MKRRRTYISLYFEDAMSHGKKKGDITLAFDTDNLLYERTKGLGSSGIKSIIGIHSYHALLEAGKKEDRSLGNLIKHKLRVHFENEKENLTG